MTEIKGADRQTIMYKKHRTKDWAKEIPLKTGVDSGKVISSDRRKSEFIVLFCFNATHQERPFILLASY